MSHRLTVNQWRKLQRKPSKYKNKRTEYRGRWYDSKHEANRAAELDVLLKAGAIQKWEPQPRFPFEYNGVKIGTYVADFRITHLDGTVIIEDAKGFKTDVYKLKKKLLKAFYNIDVVEITK